MSIQCNALPAFCASGNADSLSSCLQSIFGIIFFHLTCFPFPLACFFFSSEYYYFDHFSSGTGTVLGKIGFHLW